MLIALETATESNLPHTTMSFREKTDDEKMENAS